MKKSKIFKIKNLWSKRGFTWFKFYILAIFIVSLSFIGLKIMAQVEQTPEILKDYFKNQECPNFTDINDLTMKDQCTGLVWARHELPTFYDTAANLAAVGKEPGYTWQEANDACAALVPAGQFRLPTVEELLSLVRYKCESTTCFAKAEVAMINGAAPVFSNGYYWTSSDFQEPASWSAGLPARDYKRSVNLLNSEVDNPVFGQYMKLNAWCIADRNSEIFERKFTSSTTSNITNGMKVTGGELQTIYHRSCASDDECSKISGTICVAGQMPGGTPTIICGDGFCNGDENCTACAADCGACPLPTCGDGICNGTETCSDCEADCGACAGGTNTPPTVSVTSPTDGAAFLSPIQIVIQATASDPDGSVSQVKFLGKPGSATEPIELSTDTAAPWEARWQIGGGAGTWTVWAIATDNLGANTISNVVNFSTQPSTYKVSGKVYSITLLSLSSLNATISLASATGGSNYTATTNENGDYEINNVNSGIYNITVSKATYQNASISAFTISQNISQDFDLLSNIYVNDVYTVVLDWDSSPTGGLDSNDLEYKWSEPFPYARTESSAKLRAYIAGFLDNKTHRYYIENKSHTPFIPFNSNVIVRVWDSAGHLLKQYVSINDTTSSKFWDIFTINNAGTIEDHNKFCDASSCP